MNNYEYPAKSAGLTMLIEYVGAKDNKGNPRSVEFYAYLKSYNDTFEPKWEKNDVFGRTDPLVNYNSTSRVINVSFDIPASSLEQARDNLYKLSKLASFVYPVINSKDSNGNKTSSQFQAPPILKFSFGNLIRDYQSKGGLYGFIDSAVNINWKLEYGVFISSGSSVMEPDTGKITRMYPKIVEMSLQYQVLHNHTLGWDVASSEYLLSPYGMLLAPPESTADFTDNPPNDQTLVDSSYNIANGVDNMGNIIQSEMPGNDKSGGEEYESREPTIGNLIKTIRKSGHRNSTLKKILK